MALSHYFAGRLGCRGLRVWILAPIPASLVAIWFVNHGMYSVEMTSACLWEFVFTWGGAGGCFFVLLAARERTVPAVGCWLGRISYSAYLLLPFVRVVLSKERRPAWLSIPAAVLGTLAAPCNCRTGSWNGRASPWVRSSSRRLMRVGSPAASHPAPDVRRAA